MKYTKVFWGESRLKDIVVGATKWQVFKYRAAIALRRLVLTSFVLGLCYGSFKLGAYLFPDVVYAEKIVEVPVESTAPVLERIAHCESPTGHYKDGQVVVKSNMNGTVDIGAYQINSVHAKLATKLGYDITKAEDNKAFALYLYKTMGTEPWYSSKACWNK